MEYHAINGADNKHSSHTYIYIYPYIMLTAHDMGHAGMVIQKRAIQLCETKKEPRIEGGSVTTVPKLHQHPTEYTHYQLAGAKRREWMGCWGLLV